MFKHYSIKMKLASAMLMLTASSQLSAQIIYENSFESMPTGIVDDRAIKDAWNSRYAAGPDEGRVEILNGGPNTYNGKGVKVTYPAYGNKTAYSGATWETDFNLNAEDLYLSYWVKFDEDFDFVKGGKLPGLAGMTYFPGGENRFTARLMWREGGKLEFYLHGFNMMNSQGEEPYRVFWDDFGTHARVIPGKWHHIETRVKMNTPGQRDGRLQGWLDGVLMCDDTDNANMRAAGEGATKINNLFFSTFFGGSSSPVTQWQPKRDVYAYYDEFTISTARIGEDKPGSSSGSSTSSTSGSTSSSGGSSSGSTSSSGSSSSSSSGSSSSSSSSGGSSDCLHYSGSGRAEIDLNTANCVNVNGGMAGKTLQVWDSDANPSCNFRGTVSAGGSTLSITKNYHSTSSLSGNRLNFSSNNDCKYVKIRFY